MFAESIENLEGVRLTPLRRIPVSAGDVLHGLKQSEKDFQGFGEAYFSMVHSGQAKGWKKHTRMVMNLIVPVGEVRFFAYDDRAGSASCGKAGSVLLGEGNYQRLHVPPGIWLAFWGQAGAKSLLLNLASMEHDPQEAESRDLDDPYFPCLPIL